MVVSDIHYPMRRLSLPKLEDYLDDVNIIFALGDFSTLEVVHYLRGFRKPLVGVYGNTDTKEVKMFLPETKVIEVDRVRMGLYHGNGGPKGIENRVALKFGKAKLGAYIFGHSHVPVNRYINGIFYFNPGALSGPKQTLGFVYVDFGNIWGEIINYKENIL